MIQAVMDRVTTGWEPEEGRMGGRHQPRVMMVQDGARRRYALPAALHRAGILECMFTDWFVQPGSVEEAISDLLGLCCPRQAGKLSGRTCPELADAPVRTSPLLTMREALHGQSVSGETEHYHWCSREVGRWVRRQGFGRANALLGFVRNVDPALLASARRAQLVTVGDQIIAPAAVEAAQMREEATRWPQWGGDENLAQVEPFIEWERETWEQLDLVLCMSSYVQQGVVAQGVPMERTRLLPYPMDAAAFRCPPRHHRKGPVVVGFVGTVNLRKGIPYFMSVAQRFDPRQVHFVAIGAVSKPEAVSRTPGGDHVDLLGRLPRHDVPAWLERFDILFFPSTCEGSAGAVMEAMASGLPVVTTPNAGSVVRDGQDGFILPSGDIDGFAAAVERLIRDEELRLTMGRNARQRVESYSIDWYTRELAEIFSDLVNR